MIGQDAAAQAGSAAKSPMPDGTVTFLLTDIEGSTRMWEAHPAAMKGALERHNACVRAAVEGHGGAVTAVAITPKGCRAVSASSDGTLWVWDLATAQLVDTLEGYDGWLTALAVMPNGRVAVSGSNLGVLRVWDLEGGVTACTLEGHTDWVTAVAVAPDGCSAVSAANCTVSVWDLENGRFARTLDGHTDRVGAVAVTPDGRRAISASRDHTLRVWGLESGECIAGFTAEGPLLRFAASLDGRTIMATDKSGRGYLLRLEGIDKGGG